MATIKQINEIDNIIHVTDQTADGTESAARNMDALQGKAEAVCGSMAEMGASGGKATRALAEGVGAASDAFNGLSTTAASRVNQLGKELDLLTEKRSQLLDATRNAGASGLGTEGTATELENINAEISRVTIQMDRAQRQAHAAADAQAAWNGELTEGRSAMVSLGDSTSRVIDAQNAAVTGLSAGMDTSVKSFLRMAASAGDEVAKLTLRLETAQDRLQQMQVQARAATANGLSDDDANYGVAAQQARVDALQQQIDLEKQARAAADELTTALEEQTLVQSKSTNATKLEGYQIGILMDEAHKFFDQILAGGNPLQAAFYQVPNAVQIMGGLGNSLQLVRGLLVGPAGIALAAGAAGAAIYKLGSYAESEQSQLTQLSTHLRATRTDYADMADAAEKAARSLHESDSDLSLSDSRTAVQTIVSVPTVDSSQIERYMTDARNLAAVMGQTVPEAAKTMASALQDPAKAAEGFAQQGMPGFNAGLVLMVQHMAQAGDRTGALNSVLKVLEQTTKNAEEQALTPFQQSLKDLKDETGGVGDAVVSSFQHMGDGIVGMATAGIKGLTGLIELIEQIAPKVETATKSIWDSVASGMTWVGGKLEGGVEGGLNLLGATNLSHLMAQGTTADPQFSMPTNTNATGDVRGTNDSSGNVPSTQSLKAQDAAVTSLSAHWADLQKTVDAEIGSDSSLSGQLDDQRRKIQGLKTAVSDLNELHAAGKIADEEYATDMRNLNGQLTAANVALGGLRGPFADLIEQQDHAAQSAAALTGYDKAMVEASQQADDAARQLSGGMASASEKALVQAAAARTLAAEYKTNLTVIDRNTQLQDGITAAWAKGGAAADHATNYVEAYNYALDHFSKNAPDFNEKVKAMAAELDAFSASKRNTALSQETFANDNQIKLIGLETDTLGMNADARTKLINRMQAENAETEKGNSLQDQSVQAYLASVDALSDATTAYEHHQQVLQDVTGSLENMTDQLTDGVTQGFLQGTSSGMSFKSTLQGITTQIVGMLAKMALINPLLNKIDGGTRTTMDDVTDMLSGSSSASNAGTDKGLDQQDQEALQNWFGEKTQSGSQSSTDGLDQQDKSALNQLFGAGQGGSSGLSGLMSTKLFGTASVGSLLTGVGSGMAVGSLFSHVGKGTDGTLGSAIGSGVGSIVGSIFPVVGTVLGGIIGGAGGGILGSLFGGKHHYTIDDVSAENGTLSISRVHNHRNTDTITSGLQDDLDSLNQLYSDVGASVSDSGVVGQVYAKRYRGKHSNQTLADILPDIDLTSSDATFAKALAGGMPSSFDSVDTYAQTVQQLKQTSDALDALGVHVSKFTDATHVSVESISGYTGDLAKVLSGFDGQTVSTDVLQSQISSLKTLLDVTASGAESIVDQVQDLKVQYQQAADQAKAYGLDYQVILDKGNAIAEMTIANENRKLEQSDQSVQARYLAATGDQEGADLLNFDVSAAQQKQELDDEWRSYLGDSYASSQTYADQMADLDKTLAAERLKIQATYAAQALADQEEAQQEAAEKQAEYLSQAQSSVASAFSNLADYVQGLGTSDASPLSVQDQYKLANDNFDTDYQAAMGGDYDALTRLQSESQTALSVDKQWLGSGTDYSKAYQDMLTKLQAIGNLGADTFTANLAKQLAAQQVDATLQVKQEIQTMNATLQRLIRMQAVGAKAA
ncbi:phage-related minor tail protein [Acetobacter senegalensis]|uniref:Phage-related minor tail protein n=1 Tax=Acetobacter senegalensis TaxID=446692 RepID=A0A0U5FNJ6_9PROT|nr:phage tail length tape measure family protein [Acetobacter senegalensis]CEF41293.1 phage-related minor tail protein [Acetobacter senegalensis]